jgi:hypothetical protein
MTSATLHGHLFAASSKAAVHALVCNDCGHEVHVSNDVPDEGAILDGTITRVRDDLKDDLDKLPEGALPACPGKRPIGP